MSTRGNADMHERVEKMEAEVGQVRLRFDAIDRRFEEMDRRFDAVDRHFEELEQRLNVKIDVQVEHLEEVVRTTADDFGGVLSRIERELKDFRAEMQEESRQSRRLLGDHESRITTLERRRRR
jgi:predicted  nucleic acid-binding Zn-ribbon protein